MIILIIININSMLTRQMPPVHPGEILKEMYLEPLGIGVAQFADVLGVGRRTISLIINGHSGISAEMALRLSQAFRTTPALWLNLQQDYDLSLAAKKVELSHIPNMLEYKATSRKTM